MFEFLLSPEIWIAFFTLTALELVLGIDNIIFISILVDKLPEGETQLARRIGLFLAMFMRIRCCWSLSWIVGLTEPVLTLFGLGISGRDLILIAGGLFLIWKSTVHEVHQLLEGDGGQRIGRWHQAFRRYRPDHRHRHRLLAGFDHHRGRHGQTKSA
jgi:predicted tellurium resistance membrane protein TerC